MTQTDRTSRDDTITERNASLGPNNNETGGSTEPDKDQTQGNMKSDIDRGPLSGGGATGSVGGDALGNSSMANG